MFFRITAMLGLSGLAVLLVTTGTALGQSRGAAAEDGVSSFVLHLASMEVPANQKTGKKTGPAYQLEKVKEWRVLAGQHGSGKSDASAVEIGNWETEDLNLVIDFVTDLASKSTHSIKRTLSKARYQRLFDLSDQEAQQGDLNRILRQGVLLHTDVALLDLEKWNDQPVREGMGVFADGHALPLPKNHHWEYARRLVDCLPNSPSLNPLARQWYVATTAYMESIRYLGYAGKNLDSALKRFPSDGRILFYAGALHETWASPLNQNIVLPKGGKVSYRSREPELKLARKYFEKSVESDPDFAEAQLRLGRVLGELGDHEKAVVELQRASASIEDSLLLYYVSLYLGSEYEALSKRNEARSQYERAAALCPTAQAPLLALSELAHSGGDAEEALRAIQRLFELPRKDIWGDDPWWAYDVSHVRDAAALIEKLRDMLGGSAQ